MSIAQAMRMLFITLLALAAGHAKAITLVKDARPAAVIVVSKSALDPAKEDEAAQKVATASRALREYLKKISGAELPIISDEQDPTGPAILVGETRFAPPAGVQIPSGLTPARNEEGFLIHCASDRLTLAGNDAGPYHGTEYAVYEFLERLGVRWFMPGEFGEIVPHTTTIEFAECSILQRPDFRQRNWWLHASKERGEQERLWKLHNRMNPNDMLVSPGDSSIRDFLPSKELAKTRPELFARNQDGSVNPHHPNLTNPETIRLVAEKAKEVFRSRPGRTSIGIAPDDGIPRDWTPETLKRSQGFTDVGGREGVPSELSTTEEWIEFINAVTREVRKEFPDRIITTNGYANRNVPPQGVSIDPGVGIMFASIWSDTLHAYDDPKSWHMLRQGQMLRQWCELSDKVFIYGYNETMLVSCLTPVPLTRKLKRDMPLLKKWGVIGFNDEARIQWAESGITTRYIRARLEWKADADVSALLDDFFCKWYGAAAVPARQFWDAIEEAIESSPFLGHEDRILPYIYTPELMGRLRECIERAEKLADTDRDRLHVRVDRLIYDHLQAYMDMCDSEFAARWSEAAAAADRMMAIRKRLMDINSFFMLDHEKDYEASVLYWGATKRAKYYRKLADLTEGRTGQVVTILPDKMRFQTDPRDEGRFAGWYQPAFETSKWESISTTRPFYSQGHMAADGYPYLGHMWYRCDVDVPASFTGKPITFYAPVIETEAWLWVNGRYIAHRPYKEAYERPNDFSADITSAMKPGRNTIAIRVSTGLSAAQAAGGICGRMFLYSPK